jgi:hypothetical protein
MELFTSLLAVIAAITIPLILIGILLIISWWIAFEKAKQPGWAAIIPVYNLIVLLKLSSLHWAFVFIWVAALIPILNFIAFFGVIAMMIIVSIRVAKNFGQTGGFAVGLILLPFIFWPILAFNKNIQWTGELEKEAPGVGNEFKEEPKKEIENKDAE